MSRIVAESLFEINCGIGNVGKRPEVKDENALLSFCSKVIRLSCVMFVALFRSSFQLTPLHLLQLYHRHLHKNVYIIEIYGNIPNWLM
jgi:hypothetical protein